jgi:hypothetical protein
LIVEIFQIFRSENMRVEGDLVAETSKTQVVDSLPVAVPLKKEKMKCREGCNEMLEKAFSILTSSAGAAASANDDEW